MPVVGETFNPYRMFVGSFVPNCLMAYGGLPPMAKLLWSRLGQYAGQDGHVYPRQDTLAGELATGTRNVRYLLKVLVDAGFLTVQEPSGRDRLMHKSNRYSFVWHSIFDTSPVAISCQPGRKEPSSPGRKDPSSPGRKEPSAPGRKEPSAPVEENPVEENPVEENHQPYGDDVLEAATRRNPTGQNVRSREDDGEIDSLTPSETVLKALSAAGVMVGNTHATKAAIDRLLKVPTVTLAAVLAFIDQERGRFTSWTYVEASINRRLAGERSMPHRETTEELIERTRKKFAHVQIRDLR